MMAALVRLCCKMAACPASGYCTNIEPDQYLYSTGMTCTVRLCLSAEAGVHDS